MIQKYLLLGLILFSFISVQAQQSARYIQTTEAYGLTNPAGLAFEEMRYYGNFVNAYARNQWWNPQAPGYPQTQALSWLNNKPEQLFGAAFFADQIGETRKVGLKGRYAHGLGDNFKLGLSARLNSNRTFIENLDIYDLDDEVAMEAGNSTWQLETSLGFFYRHFHPNNAWQWFAGGAFRRIDYLGGPKASGVASAEHDILLQAGASQEQWVLAGQARISFLQPSALDLYIRRYFLGETLFLGAMATSDIKHHSLGAQLGYEWPLKSGGSRNNQYLIFSMAVSKPLSKYIEGNSLIVDARVTWVWAKD